MQSKFMSFVESFTNQAIGFVIALLTQMIVFPLYGFKVTFWDNLTMTLIFTVVSMVRGFFVRRYFNGKIVRITK